MAVFSISDVAIAGLSQLTYLIYKRYQQIRFRRTHKHSLGEKE